MVEVTVILKDDEAFQKFLKVNKVEEYTWRKGKITINLAGEVDKAMTDTAGKIPEPKIVAPEEPQPAPASSEDLGSKLF